MDMLATLRRTSWRYSLFLRDDGLLFEAIRDAG